MEIGEALGLLRNGILEFDTPDVSAVMAECCLFEWFEDGQNLVERYVESHPAAPGTDESYLFDALLDSEFHILRVQSTVPGAGLHCHDLFNGGDIFVMDISLSQTSRAGQFALATRTIRLGDYWMTGGAGLPIGSEKTLDALDAPPGELKGFESSGSMALPVLRACLAAGASEQIMYSNVPVRRREPRHMTRRRRKY